MKKIFIYSLLSSTILFSNTLLAANENYNIPLTANSTNNDFSASQAYTSGIGTLNTYDTFNVIANNASLAVKKNLIGVDKVDNGSDASISNLNLTFENGKVKGNLIGLERSTGYCGPCKKYVDVTDTINITMNSGSVNGLIMATSDTSKYNPSSPVVKRNNNIIDFEGTATAGGIEGGAGATNNTINISGGLILANDGKDKDNNTCDGNNGGGNDGKTSTCSSGTIYAGTSNPKTQNKSTNGTVNLNNMDNNNSFLKNFTEGNNGKAGMIFGSNITGTSTLNFNQINGDYKGGFKDFDNVNVDSGSTVKLAGNSYYADNWNINGTLDPNGKTAHIYKDTTNTLHLNVGSTGNVSTQFISDANVNANNSGLLNGIKTDDNIIVQNNSGGTMSGNYLGTGPSSNISVTNNGNMTGNYTAPTINVENNGKINPNTGNSTSFSASTSGTLNNNNGGKIAGDVTFNGKMNVNNKTGGSIDGATIHNRQDNLNIANTGNISNVTFDNEEDFRQITLDTSAGNITGNIELKEGRLDINNSGTSVIHDVNITTIGSGLYINNDSLISGNNVINALDSSATYLDNQSNGVVTGSLDVKAGLQHIHNAGLIQNFDLQINSNPFSINNNGTISGNNTIRSDEFMYIYNTGEFTGNMDLYAKNMKIDNYSSETLNATFVGKEIDNPEYDPSNIDSPEKINPHLKLTNGYNSEIDSNLQGEFNQLTLINHDNTPDKSAIKLTNDAIIKNVTLTNNGIISFDNKVDGNVTDLISDEKYCEMPSVAVASIEAGEDCQGSECPVSTFKLTNSGTINAAVNIQYNILDLDNSGTFTNTIDAVQLTGTNQISGNIVNNNTTGNQYALKVRDKIDFTNDGTIYGNNYAIVLGDKTTGEIRNNGTIWSHGIAVASDTTYECNENCIGDNGLKLVNTGSIYSTPLTNPNIPPALDSYAIAAGNMDVENHGIIGGSMYVNNYTQSKDGTWSVYLDKDQSKMSTLGANNQISFEQGSTIYISTNNKVKEYTNDQEFLVVQSGTMTKDEINQELNKTQIISDSPFANYSFKMKDGGGFVYNGGENASDGYIVFNHVAPETYANATDLATANHTTSILNSHRIYELFVNRDLAQSYNLSSGDNPNFDNSLNFMPIGGYASQDSKGGHAGYDSKYYGGIGYLEHDYSPNLKAGIGFAYMHNNNDYKDDFGSSSEINTYRPFVYANYEYGNFRTDIAVGYARSNIKDSRRYSYNSTVYNAKGKYDANEYSGHLNIGYKVWNQDGEIIQPIAGLYLAKLKTDSYTETGSGPMNMHIKSDDYNSAKSMLGIKMSKDYNLDNGGTFTPEMHLRWYHEMGDSKGSVAAYFLEQEQLFNTSGIEAPKDIGDLALRLTTNSGSQWDMFAEAYYQFGDNFYNVGGTVGAQYNF